MLSRVMREISICWQETDPNFKFSTERRMLRTRNREVASNSKLSLSKVARYALQSKHTFAIFTTATFEGQIDCLYVVTY